jgi:hypothetical protein
MLDFQSPVLLEVTKAKKKKARVYWPSHAGIKGVVQ